MKYGKKGNMENQSCVERNIVKLGDLDCKYKELKLKPKKMIRVEKNA